MHSFFTSGLFWFIEGILACVVVIGLKTWMEDRDVPMPLWKWLVVVCWFMGLGVTIAFVGTCLGENETHAATQGGMIFGTVVIITGVAAWRMLRIGSRAKKT
jgi:drug/metabolite transporter (DMT)-like permease